MIDLKKPIRQKSGYAARVLATDVAGRWPICIVSECDATQWIAENYTQIEVEESFENIPPTPATVRLYVWWGEDGVRIASPDPEDAQRWRANGWKVSEHLVTEPQS